MLSAFIALIFYLDKRDTRRDKIEKDRFREFVFALRSKDVEEYTQVIPIEGDLPTQDDDELIDLDQVDPETLLRAIKKQ